MAADDMSDAEDLTEAQEFASASFEAETGEFESSEAADIQAAERELEGSLDDHDFDDAVMVLEEVDVALVLPVWEPTGDAEVDAALEQLATLDELSVHDHAELLTSVHSSLHQRLTDISA